jgi:tellurite resistance protein
MVCVLLSVVVLFIFWINSQADDDSYIRSLDRDPSYIPSLDDLYPNKDFSERRPPAMGAFESRISRKSDRLEGSETEFIYYDVEVKGLFPIDSQSKVNWLVRLVDATDEDDHKPVISHVTSFQADDSMDFELCQDGDWLSPGYGFADWASIGRIPLPILHTAHSGRRKIRVWIVMQDQLAIGDQTTLWADKQSFVHNFKRKGYVEASEHVDKSRMSVLKFGIFVAFSDGEYHASEKKVLEQWRNKIIRTMDDPTEARREITSLFRAMPRKCAEGLVSISEMAAEMNSKAEVAQKFEAISLCCEVMAADGKIDKAEIETIRMIGQALELEPSEVEKEIRAHTVGVHRPRTGGEEMDILVELGIDPNKSKRRVRTEIAQMSEKISGHMAALTEGPEKSNLKRKIEALAKRRKDFV